MGPKKRTIRHSNPNEYFGERFDLERTRETKGSVEYLRNNHVSFASGNDSSHFAVLTTIARFASSPFPIDRVSEALNEPIYYPRGRGYHGEVAKQIDAIVRQHPAHRWWMSARGLVVEEVAPNLEPLSKFQRMAGPMWDEYAKDGVLDEASLWEIATRLDLEGSALSEALQPKERQEIAAHNRKNPKNQIKTFAATVAHPRFVRGVRRALSRAQKRYKTVLSRQMDHE